ncbi:MAG: hypothetical protein J7L15_02820 [Clostridiales bacterium]|nr:hypothetical protein [Clostridiales bacterium]
MIKKLCKIKGFKNKKVIFRNSNHKLTDMIHKEFYGRIFNIIYETEHMTWYANPDDGGEGFYINSKINYNVHILTKEDEPEYFL